MIKRGVVRPLRPFLVWNMYALVNDECQEYYLSFPNPVHRPLPTNIATDIVRRIVFSCTADAVQQVAIRLPPFGDVLV